MSEKFEQWAILELFGHQKMAGLVSEQSVGGCSFVRVDVPAVGDIPGYTRLLGGGAIYAINCVTEDVARAAAAAYRVRPVSSFDVPALRQAAIGFDDRGTYDDDLDDEIPI